MIPLCDQPQPHRWPFGGSSLGLVLAASAAVGLYLLAWSFGSLPVLGDEAQHFRQAVTYYEAPLASFRLPGDPSLSPADPSGLNYMRNWLWHAGLSCVWRVAGHASILAAQVYHTGFFVLLAVFTYLAGREIYGHRGGLWAWAILVTAPINLLFGTVFYLEVPMLAFAAMALWFLIRRWPILLGLAWAGMFQIKVGPSQILAAPMLLAAVFSLGDTWPRRLGRTALAVGVCAIAMVPDFLWALHHYGSVLAISPPDYCAVYSSQVTQGLGQMPRMVKGAVPLDVFDVGTVLMTLGVPGVLAVAAAAVAAAWGVVGVVRNVFGTWRASGLRSVLRGLADLWPLESQVAGVPFIFYVLVFAAAPQLRGSHDMRYFHPAILPASLLAGGLLARWQGTDWPGRRRWLARGAYGLLVAAMAVQALAVPPYVRTRRTLPPQVVAGFDWIRTSTPPHARFLYLEVNMLALTGRPVIWASVVPQYLFNASDERQIQMLYYLHTDYIAIHPTRLCDTSSRQVVPTAYPRPWVRSLAGKRYLTLVYPPGGPAEEGEFLVYRIDYDKVPPAWLVGNEPTWFKGGG